MANQINEVVPHLRRSILRRDEFTLTDGELLRRFIEQQDSAAVELLVRRHGPMVWGVCLRLLGNAHDAEDAFQAAFLVLLRKAQSVTRREAVGAWLFGVARQTASKARSLRARRREREKQVEALPEVPVPAQHDHSEDRAVLDQELSRLPEKYHSAIVLCDLEGITRKEAARRLGVPEGTLAGRLNRGRALLANRLARRGLAVSGGLVAALLSQYASASVPPSVMGYAIEAVTRSVGRAAIGAIPGTVAVLTEGVMKAMLLNKLMKLSAALLVVVACGLGAAGLAFRAQADQAAPAAALRRAEKQPDKQKQLDTAKAMLDLSKADLAVAEAQLAVARARHDRAAALYQKLKDLQAKGIAPKKEIEPLADWPTDAPIRLWPRFGRSTLDRRAAEQRVRDYLGVGKAKELQLTPAYLTDKDFPFVRPRKQAIWLAEVKDLRLKGGALGHLYVAIDSDSGQLIEAFTPPAQPWWRKKEQVIGPAHEKYLRETGQQLERPGDAPRVTILEALRGFTKEGQAQLVVRYAQYSNSKSGVMVGDRFNPAAERRPALVIFREGVQAKSRSGQVLGRASIVVDAQTGDSLHNEFSGNPVP